VAIHARPLQVCGDPLLLAPRQELGLQLSQVIERVAQHELAGLAAKQSKQQRPRREGGGAGEGDGDA